MQVLEVWSETTAPAADYESLLRAQPNERASNEENVTAAQAVSAVEPGKGLKKQPTQVHSFHQQIATSIQSSHAHLLLQYIDTARSMIRQTYLGLLRCSTFEIGQ